MQSDFQSSGWNLTPNSLGGAFNWESLEVVFPLALHTQQHLHGNQVQSVFISISWLFWFNVKLHSGEQRQRCCTECSFLPGCYCESLHTRLLNKTASWWTPWAQRHNEFWFPVPREYKVRREWNVSCIYFSERLGYYHISGHPSPNQQWLPTERKTEPNLLEELRANNISYFYSLFNFGISSWGCISETVLKLHCRPHLVQLKDQHKKQSHVKNANIIMVSGY